jgi:hypothetical protein
MNDFGKNLKWGQVGESKVSVFFQQMGYSVLPVYEKIVDEGKGPQVYQLGQSLVAPDSLVFNGTKAFWVEAKMKTSFSLHRITGNMVTGIDLRHYKDYVELDGSSPWDVWITFLHLGGKERGSAEETEPGLFTNNISTLSRCENHRSTKWAGGMVYWAKQSLVKIADYKNGLIIPTMNPVSNPAKRA